MRGEAGFWGPAVVGATFKRNIKFGLKLFCIKNYSRQNLLEEFKFKIIRANQSVDYFGLNYSE